MKKRKLLLSILWAVVFMMISCSAFAELKGHSAMEMLIEARRKIGSIEFTGTPTVVQTGQAVTLSWKILPKNPQDKIIGEILIDYVGINSGKYSDLPKIGQKVVCPLGNTTYHLKIFYGAMGQLAAVQVKAPCPEETITEEIMQAVVKIMKSNMAAYDKSIVVSKANLEVNSSGISLSIAGEKKVKNFPDIDVKVNMLVYPIIKVNQIKADIKKFNVDIGSTATRIAWDVITVGVYEGVKAGLERYFENEWKPGAKTEIEDQLNSYVKFQPNDTPIIDLPPGKIKFTKCKKCQ
jgi:ribosome maturation factor RimP